VKVKKAIRVAKECGLETFGECYNNISIHSMLLFEYSKIDEELNELQLELEDLSKEFGVSIEELFTWKIKEIENDI